MSLFKWIRLPDKKLLYEFTQSILQDKRKLSSYIILLLLITIVSLIMSHNYKWYDKPIVKITAVENSFSHANSVDDWSKERYYDQRLIGLIMNGTHKGKEVFIQNQYSSSGIYDERYKVSDEVFASISTGEKNILTGTITGLKRDKYLALPFFILLVAILLVIRKKGILTILSLFTNIFIFWYALKLYEQGTNLLILSRYMMIFFTTLSLLLISGVKVKTFAAIFSTLATVGIISLLFKLVMTYSNGVDYAYMDYILNPNNLDDIFESQLLIGGLGAIMDISISMAAMINELLTKDKHIGFIALWKSGRELGHDIMGTMINVMLFTFLCGSIPMIILEMEMNIRLYTIVSFHMTFEIYRFLLGGIGIMIAVPISLVISTFLLKKWRR